MNKINKNIKGGYRSLKNAGAIRTSIKALEKIDRKFNGVRQTSIKLMVKDDDLLTSDPRKPIKQPPKKAKEKYKIGWVMSPPGRGSGGHQNIYRFIKFLEEAGHECSIYLYSNFEKRTIKEIQQSMGPSYADVTAKMYWLDDSSVEDNDAVFATGWETAYPVYGLSEKLHKFYFVQDYEPYFFPVGSEYVLAENTYRFGYTGITAGGWLSKKLNNDFGMRTDHFDFGSDESHYVYSNSSARKEILFYARPVTARRGFEMGIAALTKFHKNNPNVIINLVGWDTSTYKIPFPHNNLMMLELNELSALYNRCSAALVMSLTNMSLLPLELLSCGTIPVVNDGENNRLVSDNPFIAYADNNPVALAEKLDEVVRRKDLGQYSKLASESVPKNSWKASGKKFVSILEREMSRG
jgi:hypothetical protein